MTDLPDGLPARQAGLRLLHDAVFRRMGLDAAEERNTLLAKLEPRDRAFARLLVLTTLRRRGEIDLALAPHLHTPLDKLDPPRLADVLRLGAAQILFLGTKPHAAVNTSVDLAVAEGLARQKSLVNAVLRRVSEAAFTPAPEANAPGWLLASWTADYGAQTAQALALAHAEEAPVDFTVKNDPEKWAALLEAEVLPTGSLRRKTGGFIPALPGFDEGAWWVQNAAAALPARLLGDIAGKSVIDLCAAPGGKTAQLAALGARVTAVDRSAARLDILKENLFRLGLEATVIVADGVDWQPGEKADAVLLDAPCSATGTIRHQPDMPYLRTPDDVARLVQLQRRLLANAARMLKPGGTLVYCTCALQKDEGERQADWILSGALPLEFSPVLPGEIVGTEGLLTPRGELRCLPSLWPERGGMDGFYAVRFTAVSAPP